MHGVISWLLVLLRAQMSIFQLFVSVLDVTYALEFRNYILTYPAALSSVGTNFFPAITDYLDKAPKQLSKLAKTGLKTLGLAKWAKQAKTEYIIKIQEYNIPCQLISLKKFFNLTRLKFKNSQKT